MMRHHGWYTEVGPSMMGGSGIGVTAPAAGPGPAGQRTFAWKVLLLAVFAAFPVVAETRTAVLHLAVYAESM